MKKNYPVTNLRCANCALGVEKKLRQEKGVLSAEVSLATNSATIDFDPSKTSPEKLREAVRSIGYDMIIEGDEDERLKKQEEAQELKLRKLKTYVIYSWVFAIVIMTISMAHLSGIFSYIQLLLALPVLFVFGRDFFINGWRHAVKGNPNMDTLVALSTSIAFLFSLFTTFFPSFWLERGIEPTLYYEASVMIIAFVLLGKMLEEMAKGKTTMAIKSLMKLQPKEATVARAGVDGTLSFVQVPVSDLQISDIILVKPGERIPVDGVVVEGSSFVDESAITGESILVEKLSGAKVVSGSINGKGSFMFRAERVGKDTILSQIIRVVRDSQASKAPVQRIVDKVASVFVPVVVAASLLTFTVWMLLGGTDLFPRALLSAISVLVIACPCAMGLATPTALLVGIGKAAQNLILIKDAAALERTRIVDTVVLDKTGTITTGQTEVTDWIWLEDNSVLTGGFTKEEFMNVIVAMERRSEHPLAGAIINFLEDKTEKSNIDVESFENIPGQGVTAIFKDHLFWAGNERMVSEKSIVESANGPLSKCENLKSEGKSILFLGIDNICVAIVAVADSVSESSVEALRSLREMGIEVHMLTGDNVIVATNIAAKLGITHFLAGVLPSEKEEYIIKLQKEGRIVAMVGDGVNDSQALAVADVSIAMGKGTDIAMDVAMMTLMTSDLRLLPAAFAISERTVRLIHQNLFWAFFYNIVGIPIAAGVLYPFYGITLNPMIAAAAMAFSSISVVLNSLRLGKFNYHPKG
jgi:Cu2+-exporting ATPase